MFSTRQCTYLVWYVSAVKCDSLSDIIYIEHGSWRFMAVIRSAAAAGRGSVFRLHIWPQTEHLQ